MNCMKSLHCRITRHALPYLIQFDGVPPFNNSRSIMFRARGVRHLSHAQKDHVEWFNGKFVITGGNQID